jgi:sugar/nucleoside kinase (ribokinase family)
VSIANALAVFSPNHEEAGTLFGEAIEEQEAEGKPQKIEELAQRYLDLGLPSTVIIRSGKLGAYIKQAAESGKSDLEALNGVWIIP